MTARSLSSIVPVQSHAPSLRKRDDEFKLRRRIAKKKLPVKNAKPAGALSLDMESQLVPASPLAAKPIDQTFALRLGGNMSRYDWSINDILFDIKNPRKERALARVKQGQRVALKFITPTTANSAQASPIRK